MFLQDLRGALRVFRHEPGFAAVAVLTLSLGIGANAALFAVVDAVLLRPLPIADAEALVVLKHRDRATGISKDFIAVGDFVDLRDRQQSLETLAGYGAFQASLFGDGEPLRVEGLAAAPELLPALRVQPALGRLFAADDARQDAPPVVMIGYDLWRTRFGGDPAILSRSIQLGTSRRLVVGVAPPGFHFPPDSPTQVIVPLPLPITAPAQRRSGWTFALGRLRAGQTLATAQQDIAALAARFEREFPDQNRGSEYFVQPLRDALVGDTKRPLQLLLGAVGFVLLIACANVGNLLLARALGRRQDTAVRLALGASRSRLVVHVLTEALVLALVGGAIGVLIAWQAAPVLATLVPDTAKVPGLHAVGVNLPVLGFSLAASLVAAALFGGLSCLTLLTGTDRDALIATRRTTTGSGARRAAGILVAAEMALAVILLVGAGLTLRSFANLLAVDPGFRTANVLTVQMAIPAARYATPAARADFYARAFAALDALPDVDVSGAAVVTPLTGNNWTAPFERLDRPTPAGERAAEVGWQSATKGYFTALRIPLRAGRLFDDRDAASAVPPVVISEEVARRFFPGESPLGHRLRGGDGELEIVGVVGDIRRAALTDRPRADMYFPFARFADSAATLFVRTPGDPEQAVPAIRTALRSLEPEVVLHGARSLDEIAMASAATTRLAMRLLAGFAVVAVVLAAVGIYGVMAHSVRRRTRELGTRLALGASRGDIVRLVLREGAAITAVGLAVGLGAGLLLARSLSAVLYGVPPADPWSMAAAAGVLGVMALMACYLPARHAARVDPAFTLSAE